MPGAPSKRCGRLRSVVSAVEPSLLLGASANGHYLQRATGEPCLLVGNAAWSLSQQLDQEDALVFLDNQQAKGINALIVDPLRHFWTTNAPSNIFGDSPFTGTVAGAGGEEDLSTPRTAFWNHVKWVTQQAAARSIVLVMPPLYQGNGGVGPDGWYPESEANSLANHQAYGEFLGEFFADCPNIIWLMGGDRNWDTYSASAQAKHRALGEAIKAAEAGGPHRHLMTAHILDSQAYLVEGPWQDCTFVYCDSVTHNDVQDAYQAPVTQRPAFLGEALYVEGPWEGPDPSRQKVRSQYWQTLTSGGCGFIHGDENVWPFGGSLAFGSTLDWEGELDNDFMADVVRIREFFAARAWWLLEPDTSSTLVTSDRGTLGTASYVTAAKASNGSFAVVYVPGGGAIQVQCNQLSGPVTARWYDPTTGEPTLIGSGLTGSQSFDPPLNAAGDTDLVLLLEAT